MKAWTLLDELVETGLDVEVREGFLVEEAGSLMVGALKEEDSLEVAAEEEVARKV